MKNEDELHVASLAKDISLSFELVDFALAFNPVGCFQAHALVVLVQALRRITRTMMQRVAVHGGTSAKYRHLDGSPVDV
jgi:hypothetical protein